MHKTAGRLIAIRYPATSGDKVVIKQTHRNGSDEVVGEIELDGEELEDALYVLTRAKHNRDTTP